MKTLTLSGRKILTNLDLFLNQLWHDEREDAAIDLNSPAIDLTEDQQAIAFLQQFADDGRIS